jgi:hypothetical protein
MYPSCVFRLSVGRDLEQYRVTSKFRFGKRFEIDAANSFLLDFFNDPEVRANLRVRCVLVSGRPCPVHQNVILCLLNRCSPPNELRQS